MHTLVHPQAIEEQVFSDHALLRERIAKLSGAAGLVRLDDALRAAREADPLEPSSASETSDAASGSEVARRATNPASTPTKKPLYGASELPSAGPSGAAEPTSSEGATGKPLRATTAGRGIARGFFNSSASTKRGGGPAQTTPEAPTAAPSARPAGLSADAVSNLTMIYDLLHDPDMKLPAQDLDTSFEALWGAEGRKNSEGIQVTDTSQADSEGSAEVRPQVGRAIGALITPSELEGLSPDQAVALIRSRAKIMAESAFWDAVCSRIKEALQVSGVGVLCFILHPLSFIPVF